VQRLRNHIPYSDYLAAFSETRIPVRWPTSAPNLEPRDDIWPTDKAPVIRRMKDGTNQFNELRWGFRRLARRVRRLSISVRRVGKFPVGRCLIPASTSSSSREEVAEDQVEVHEGRRGVVLLRRAVASNAGWRRRFYAAHD